MIAVASAADAMMARPEAVNTMPGFTPIADSMTTVVAISRQRCRSSTGNRREEKNRPAEAAWCVGQTSRWVPTRRHLVAQPLNQVFFAS
jgi:hypothetical protein